jgi:hypothetical protein
MWRPLIPLLLATAAHGQVLLNPARIPARLLHFEPQPGEKPLRCEAHPIRPILDFSFRFQAGYVVQVPMSQFQGAGHFWSILLRVTPEGGAPVYLGSRIRLPQVPRTKTRLELGGGYVVGAGRYQVAWQLSDETGRVCRSHWKVDAHPTYVDRKVRLAMAPESVLPLYARPPGDRHDDAPPLRVTILLDVAPLSPRRTRMSARDNMMLLGTLAALLDRLPTSSVRLAAFNLDQQTVLYRQDGFTEAGMRDLARAIQNLQLGLIDYHVLQNRGGNVALLADLVNRELKADPPSDAVLFLGPMARVGEHFPDQLLDRPDGPTPRFFYLQYRPPFLRMQATLPDLIHSLVSHLKGKVIVMNSPGDFEKGIRQIELAGPLDRPR